MIQRQRRINRITRVYQEFLAARTAGELLTEQLRADPSYGLRFGWKARSGRDFVDNLESTYLIRIYAEFEAALRAYWRDFLGQPTYPKMVQLVNEAIPNERFTGETIERADRVRKYRNSLVHEDREEEGDDGDDNESLYVPLTDALSYLNAYLGRLDPKWE